MGFFQQKKDAKSFNLPRLLSSIIAPQKLGGVFKDFLFSPLFGEGFSDGLKPPTRKGLLDRFFFGFLGVPISPHGRCLGQPRSWGVEGFGRCKHRGAANCSVWMSTNGGNWSLSLHFVDGKSKQFWWYVRIPGKKLDNMTFPAGLPSFNFLNTFSIRSWTWHDIKGQSFGGMSHSQHLGLYSIPRNIYTSFSLPFFHPSLLVRRDTATARNSNFLRGYWLLILLQSLVTIFHLGKRRDASKRVLEEVFNPAWCIHKLQQKTLKEIAPCMTTIYIFTYVMLFCNQWIGLKPILNVGFGLPGNFENRIGFVALQIFAFSNTNPSPRHPVISSADDWGVQSPPQHSI